MDPVTAIVAVLSAGGALVLKEAATAAVRDAYSGLKTWIHGHYPGVSIEQLEQQPASEARQKVVGEDLEREHASGDVELLKLAQTLIVLIQTQAPDVARSIGVDLSALDQANVTFGNVLAGKGATGVKIEKVSGGSLHFGDVTASTATDSLKKA
jgi:hypothetical protein